MKKSKAKLLLIETDGDMGVFDTMDNIKKYVDENLYPSDVEGCVVYEVSAKFELEHLSYTKSIKVKL